MNVLEAVKSKEDWIREISSIGPAEEHYKSLMHFFNDVATCRTNGQLSEGDLLNMRSWFNGSMSSTETMQGHACLKPRGYDGDYLIIDKIYTHRTSQDPVFAKWDRFFHSGDAPIAVRNRKTYFIDKLKGLGPKSSVLNLASGPCRDLLEYFEGFDMKLKVDCVDLDPEAIAYGKALLGDRQDTRFYNENIFRFRPSVKYDLIWSAGLFDYLTEKQFRLLLRRLSNFVNPGGKIVIGNFNNNVQSKDYMEFGNWILNYRSSEELLAYASEISNSRVSVESEPLNVNLFLNIEF
jgi:SAM-dependent methyltransferase